MACVFSQQARLRSCAEVPFDDATAESTAEEEFVGRESEGQHARSSAEVESQHARLSSAEEEKRQCFVGCVASAVASATQAAAVGRHAIVGQRVDRR
jgi:hypothetical protein